LEAIAEEFPILGQRAAHQAIDVTNSFEMAESIALLSRMFVDMKVNSN
jgi:hypothetical protein